jgi:hypothetical protein
MNLIRLGRAKHPLPWREVYMLPSSSLPPSWGELTRKGRGNFDLFTLSPTLSPREGEGTEYQLIS